LWERLRLHLLSMLRGICIQLRMGGERWDEMRSDLWRKRVRDRRKNGILRHRRWRWRSIDTLSIKGR